VSILVIPGREKSRNLIFKEAKRIKALGFSTFHV
jgi:hypothetical protein